MRKIEMCLVCAPEVCREIETHNGGSKEGWKHRMEEKDDEYYQQRMMVVTTLKTLWHSTQYMIKVGEIHTEMYLNIRQSTPFYSLVGHDDCYLTVYVIHYC